MTIPRIILHAALLSAAILRFNVFSGIYLLFILFILPLGNKYRTLLSCLCMLLTLSIAFFISHIGTQVILIFYPKILDNCSIYYVNYAHQIGITNLYKVRFIHFIRIMIPDVWMAVTCVISIIILRKKHRKKIYHIANRINRITAQKKVSKTEKLQSKLWNSWLYQRIKIIVNLFLTGFVGIISPSILNMAYLVLFLLVCTLWASGFNFTPLKLYYIRVFILTYTGMHILLIYATQFEFFQQIFPDGNLINRLLGLYYCVNSSCMYNGEVKMISQRLMDYFNPIFVVSLYYIYSLDSEIWIDKETIHNLATIHSFSQRFLVMSNSDSHNQYTDTNFDEGSKSVNRPLLSSITNAFIRNSYILTFIAMMAWSVSYMSWLTFMLLLLASILWLLPDSRKACLYTSPIIVGYGIILIFLNYISNVNAQEIYNLFASLLYFDLTELGLFRWNMPVIPLAITLGFLVIFWLTLRLFSKERNKHTKDLMKNPKLSKFKDDFLFRRFVDFGQNICAKYWIFLCCIILLTMSIQEECKACYIIYVILMCYFIILFMFRYTLWRKQMYTFWWIIVTYSLALLFGIYTYQFNIFKTMWHKYTPFTDCVFEDFGLVTYSSTALFKGLIIPVIFLVVTIFQVDYVHKPFMNISDLTKQKISSYVPPLLSEEVLLQESSSGMSSYSHNFVISTVILLLSKLKKVDSTQDNFVVELNYFVNDVNSALNILSRNLAKLFNNIYLKLWRLLEVHFTKLVVISVFSYSVIDVNLYNSAYILLIILFYPFNNLHELLVLIITLLLSIQLISSMIYQLCFFDINWQTNCSQVTNSSFITYENIDNLKFIGLTKYNNFREHFQFAVLNLIICSLWYVIKYHQIQHFNITNARCPERSIIFPDFSIADLDDTPLSFLKYILNFAFYKIGLELSFIMTIVNVYIRGDAMSLIYLFLLMIFLPCSRLYCSKLWTLYLFILTLFIPFQYFLIFVFYPFNCNEYPEALLIIGRIIFKNYKDDDIKGYKLIGDMIQLMFVISQHHVFLTEKSSANYKGGDNRPFLANEIPSSYEKDFLCHNGSYVDYLKVITFYWFYWICLAILFLNGIMRNTVFCFGYMILATIYFWIGQKIMLKKRKYLLSMWNVILCYNFFVIMSKTILRLLDCILYEYIMEHSYCWVIHVIGIQCDSVTINLLKKQGIKTDCKVESSVMYWDVFCFVMLILQRKIFMSKLFCFVVLHLKIQNKFASRGAQLISKKLLAILKHEKHKEDLIFAKIQQKIIRIEQTHQNYGKPLPNEHYLVLRSGDYFLFDGNPEDEDNDYTEKDIQSSSETQNESGSDNKHVALKDKLKTKKIIRETDEELFSISKSEAISPTKRKLNEIKYKDLGKIGHKGNLKNQKNKSNEISKLRTHYTLINPPRKSSSSDETYFTPMTNYDGVKNRNIAEESKVNVDRCLRRGEDSANYRAPISNTLRKKISLGQMIGDAKAKENGFWSKSKAICKACYDFFIKCLITLIKIINRCTQDSRNVSQILDNEKQIIKKKIIVYAEGDWLGKESNEFFVLTSQGQTLGIDYTMEAYITSTADIFRRQYRVVELNSINVEIFENDKVFDNNAHNFSKINTNYSIIEECLRNRSKTFMLILAIGNLIMIYSELLCYIVLIFNHMISFNLISLVYPLSIFLWGMLSVPRPSTIFWMFIILYTQLVIVTKYIFQFNFIDFTTGVYALEISSPFFLPVIIGIDKAKQFALMDLIQLLVLFLHRGYLKDNGLWISYKEIVKSDDDSDEDYQKSKRNIVMYIIIWPFSQLRLFYNNLVTYRYSKRVDFYVYMFLCEFISFFIIVLGYKTFSLSAGSSSSALDLIKENKIPVQFILMLITQFIFIIIDRALFLRKQVTGKLFFLIFHVILIHAWIFLLNPYLSQSKFNAYLAPQLLYFTKCLYFGFSAYQIKSGYPLRILGNFLTKKNNYVNLFLFKAYMVIPFLYELRNVMDWIWTDTSVSLYHWMEIEDVFTKIFVIKCWRRAENEYPTHRGLNRWVVSKILVGGILMSFFFICLWGPLTVGSIIGATFVKNPPLTCKSSLQIEGYSNLFQYTSRNQNMKTLNNDDFGKIKTCYKNNLEGLHYLKKFEANDITVLELGLDSDDSWTISPPNLERFIRTLSAPKGKPQINFVVVCERMPKDTINTNVDVSLTYSRPLIWQERIDFINALFNNATVINLINIIPKYIVAKKKAMIYIADEIFQSDDRFLSANISYQSDNIVRWWRMEVTNPSNCTKELKTKVISIYILSERISDSLFGQLFARYGILGMYAAYILVAHRLMRAVYADISYIIRCEELPYVDRILTILNEIYLVRENKMFRLEEQLVAKLIFLYRSSETMIKWTRHKQSTLQEHMD